MCLVANTHQTQNLRHLLADLPRGLMQYLHGKRYILKYCLFWQQTEILEHRPHLTAKLRDLPVRQFSDRKITDLDRSLIRIDLFQNQLDKR